MKVSIHTNSEAPIGALIETLLAQADDVFIASAYISAKAIDTLSARMQKFGSGGLTVDVLFGMDTETALDAIQRVYEAAAEMPEQLRVRYTPHRAGRLFHPKAYYFRVRSHCHILIASANLTGAGHFSNEEAYCHIEVPVEHEAAKHFNAIRQTWFSNPFSAVLDQKVIDSLEGIEYYKAQLQKHRDEFAQIISHLGKGEAVVVPLMEVLAPIRTVLATGYLITPSFSLSNLSVSVQDILKPTEDNKPDEKDKVIIVQNRFSASVTLLPEDIVKKFSDLQRVARALCEAYSFPLSAGQYVPAKANTTLIKAIKELEREHKKLVTIYIKDKKVINQHLEDKLEKECQEVWRNLNLHTPSPFPDDLLPVVRERIQKRRAQIEANPALALRFSFEAFPHPLVMMNAMPNHIAWKLQGESSDQELLLVFISLLRAQIALIQGVTRWGKPSIIKREYERMLLLVSVRGKIIDGLLRLLSKWVIASQTKRSDQSLEQKKVAQQKKANEINKNAKAHLDRLLEIEAVGQSDQAAALSKLSEYYTLQV